MRIVATSDTHSKHKQVPIPDGDIFIHAGDLTPRGNHNEFISVGNWFHDLKDRFKYRIFIAGNHDFSLMWNSIMILQSYFDEDVIYLEDKGVEIEGFKIYGSPWVPQFMNWAFMKFDDDLKPHWDAIPDDTQILITHGAPHGVLDKWEDRSVGSVSLSNRIKELPHLKHHIFGHLHEGYGQEKVQYGQNKDRTVNFYNVAALNGDYQYQNAPQVIDL